MFPAAEALLTGGLSSRKHGGVHALFGEQFIGRETEEGDWKLH